MCIRDREDAADVDDLDCPHLHVHLVDDGDATDADVDHETLVSGAARRDVSDARNPVGVSFDQAERGVDIAPEGRRKMCPRLLSQRLVSLFRYAPEIIGRFPTARTG